MRFDGASSLLTHPANNGTYLRDTTLDAQLRSLNAIFVPRSSKLAASFF